MFGKKLKIKTITREAMMVTVECADVKTAKTLETMLKIFKTQI
jgi:hypothetical protein